MSETSEIIHSKKIMASYSSGFFVNEVIQGVLLFLLFFFYIVEIGLSPWLTGLAVIIYTIWDAFNDPLIGYLTDRPFRFTKKWGRRFPWILLGFVPMLISFILVFTPPNVNAQEQPWIIFGWLTFTLCLFDTCETLFTTNYFSLYPDKFRTNEERRTTSVMSIYIGFIGVVFAALLPPMIVEFGNLGTYFLMALICIFVNFICLFLMLPGVRDDKDTVENFILKFKEREKEPLLKTLKSASKHKSFLAFLLIYMLYLTLTNMVQGSFYFWIAFIRGGDVSDVLYVMLMFLFGSVAGIPLWYYYNKKTGDNRKTMLYSGLSLILLTVFFSLITDFTAFLILTFIWAMALSGFWTFYYVVFSDVIDESIAETGMRREGLYHGIRRFFGNLARALQAFYFAIVLELTGFREGATVQTALAKTGILLLIGIIPAITMGVGFIIFWRVYDITPEKSKTIKEKLKQLKI